MMMGGFRRYSLGQWGLCVMSNHLVKIKMREKLDTRGCARWLGWGLRRREFEGRVGRFGIRRVHW